MFDKKFEERMLFWRRFREDLETSRNPFQDVIEFYNRAPRTRLCADPWDQSTWPDPWELLNENQYCEFGIVLGMCYSLQLTDRFKGSKFEIHISTNNEISESYYLLYVDNNVLGLEYDTVVPKEDLPDALYSQRIYPMLALQ